MVRVRRPRLERAERLRDRSLPLVGVGLQGVVRRSARVHVGLQELRQHVSVNVTVPAAAAAHDAHLRDVTRQALDLRQHVLPQLVKVVVVRLARVPHGGDVEGLSVLLAAAFVVVAHDVLVDVLLLVAQVGLLAVGAQGEHEENHHWREEEIRKHHISFMKPHFLSKE